MPFKKNDVNFDISKKNDLEKKTFSHHNCPLEQCNSFLRHFFVLSKNIFQVLKLGAQHPVYFEPFSIILYIDALYSNII